VSAAGAKRIFFRFGMAVGGDYGSVLGEHSSPFMREPVRKIDS
jgi:hypothetical protein